MKTTTYLFDKGGKHNTGATIEIARERALETYKKGMRSN